jgi:hypothetical protein
MKNYCDELHQLCANLPRYKYPFKNATFPQNGIYIVLCAMYPKKVLTNENK